MIEVTTGGLSSARLSLPTKMSGRLLTLVLASAWGWASDARAADYWVAPNGRDATVRGSRSHPWATLQYAADRIREGDTVHVLDGDYEGFYLTRGGKKDAPVQIRADGGHVRITKRNRETPDGINIEGASHIIIDGFVIDGMPRTGIRATHSAGSTIRRIVADRNRSWGIFTSFCDDIVIEGNTVSRSIQEHGIYVSNSGDRPVIRGNTSRGNRQCGIHINGDASQGGDGIISGARIENNLISDNGRGGGSGINCDGVQDSRIQNNLLHNNHANGISLYRIDGAAGSTGNSVINNTVVQATDSRWAVNIKNRSTNNVVANNILMNEGPRGSLNVSSDSLAGLRSDHNILVDRLSPDDGEQFLKLSSWRSATGLDGHSRVSRPRDLFVNPDAADYHLRHGSQAIGAADIAISPGTDIEGVPRPVGAVPDAGAYERRLDGGGTSSSADPFGGFLLATAVLLSVAVALAVWRIRDLVPVRLRMDRLSMTRCS
jgi:parallel beta-helix repeat protein